MLKRFILVAVVTLLFVFQFPIANAAALELTEEDRTVLLNEQGEEIVLSQKEYALGQKIFNDTCSQCHNSGRTKTNPNVSLSKGDLAAAFPRRDNIEAMVDYLKVPYTYDGESEISVLHPNTKRSDLFAEMRNLTDDDLEALSGYILAQPKIRGEKFWGGGKVFN
ncbi:MAG: photosystem II cytochrome c-550 [Prochloraceae cyanobacterium]|nr:photosystem II cytochrome c-550 [Prochloraceae cyanobacterium]